MTARTARALSTNRLQDVVSQNTHGFVIGNVICRNNITSNSWKLASADSLINCQGSCMVSDVIDANTFVLSQEGYIVNYDASLPVLVDATQYYLDTNPLNAGKLTATRPSSVGQVILPCFDTDSATSGYFFGGSGQLIESGVLLNTINEAGDITLAPNTRYFCTPASSPQNLALPTTAVPGDVIIINAWNLPALDQILITQDGAQQIFGLGGSSTAGMMGGLLMTDNYSSITLICQTGGANSIWFIENSNGPNAELI